MKNKLIDDAQARKAVVTNMFTAEVATDKFLVLVKKLLALGGEKVAPVSEPDLDLLINEGHIFDHKVRLHKMIPNACHRNATSLWNIGSHTLVTGWALREGCWRQHSWCLQESRKKTEIVETTVPMEIYFGIELFDELALNAWLSNSDDNAARTMREVMSQQMAAAAQAGAA